MAATVDPPDVTTSSTTRQRSPGSSKGPSMRRWRPWALVSLRTKNADTSAPPARAAQASGSAPMVSPPTALGAPLRAWAATSCDERAEARGPQNRPLGVHVVLGDGAAGERDLADDEGVLAQDGHQSVSYGQAGHLSARS